MIKKGNLKIFLAATIIFVGTLLISSIIFFAIDPENNPIRKIAEELNIINPNSDENADQEDSGGGGGLFGGGGGSGGGGSGGGGGDPGPDPSCIREAYNSILNINKIQTCNTYDGEICIDKTIECSAEIHNDDSVLGGNFGVELAFVEDGKDKSQAVKNSVASFYLTPESFQSFEDSVRVQSVGIDGVANKNVNCFFGISEIPSELIC